MNYKPKLATQFSILVFIIALILFVSSAVTNYSIFYDGGETNYSTTNANTDCNNKGSFTGCSNPGLDYNFWRDTEPYAGSYSLKLRDWDTFNYSAGLWFTFKPSTNCSGQCQNATLSFYYHNYGLSSTEKCGWWARYDNGTTVDLWFCQDGSACDHGTVDSTPELADFNYSSIRIEDYLNMSYTGNIYIHLGASLPSTSDICWFDEINFTASVTDSNPDLASVTINSPTNRNYSTSTILINITSNGNATWYSWNNTNVTYSSAISTNFGSDGLKTLKVWANNSVSNITTASVNFTVDTTAPIFTTIPSNVSINNVTNWTGVDFDATDNLTSIAFFVNNTNFTINQTGHLNWTSRLAVGVYYVNVSVNDSVGNINSTVFKLNVTLFVDIIPPTFTTIPANATITYGNAWSGVQFVGTDETSFGTYSANDTRFLINSTGFLNWTGQLAVGVYYLNISINDSSANRNSTTYSLTINQATPTISYYLNSQANNLTINFSQIVNASVSSNGGIVNIFRNETNVSLQNNLNQTLSAGYYVYKFNVTGNTNYTSLVGGSLFLTINKDAGACDILFNTTSPISYGDSFLVWSNCNSNFNLTRNGTVILNNSVQALNVGSYNFSVQREDTQNYTNYFDEENFMINALSDTTNPSVDLINPANNSVIRNSSININASISDETNLSNATLYLWNSTELINTTLINLSEPSHSLSLDFNLSDGVYVFSILVLDSSGNQNDTGNYSFTVNLTEELVTPPSGGGGGGGGGFVVLPEVNNTVVNQTLWEKVETRTTNLLDENLPTIAKDLNLPNYVWVAITIIISILLGMGVVWIFLNFK
jgi:hypothetical protein